MTDTNLSLTVQQYWQWQAGIISSDDIDTKALVKKDHWFLLTTPNVEFPV